MTQTITIAPAYDYLRTFVEQIPQCFLNEGEEVYRQRNLIKVLTAPDGTRLNVKRYHVPAGPNRLIYSLGLRKPKAQRAFTYPKRLLAAGIATPQPVALIEERNVLHLLGFTYFVSLQCDYGHTLYEMGAATPADYLPLAEALAQLAARMHEQQILHCDFTPGNILWRRDEEGYHFQLVDINRMYFGPVSVEKGLLSMIRLWGPKVFIEHLMRCYAQARHANPDEALLLAMPARARFWRRFQRKHDIPFPLEL